MTDNHRANRADHLHKSAIVIDTHCDTTQRLEQTGWNISERQADGHLDLPRLREGGVSAVFFAVWAAGPLAPGEGARTGRAQIERIRMMVETHPDSLTAARTADDVESAHRRGKIAVLIAIEGGYLIEDSLDVLQEYHDAGAAYMTLTHAFHTSWADSSGVHEDLAPRHGGLTAFGREVVTAMNRLAMMVDVSHVSDATFWHVIETTQAPVIATHSSCRAVSDHRRNLSDDMMRAIAETGGTVQINFAAAFIDKTHPPIARVSSANSLTDPRGGDRSAAHATPLSVLVDHFDHAMQTIGPDHIGIGSDFDGVPGLPVGMEDCSKLPALTAELLARGYSELDVSKVLGANVLRVMRRCVEVADSM